ncbi:Amino acid permease [Singulisphaera sp. GP187]|uniref:APC family permease n=1 Tax=Singulisphaera sp. GP187 TaxID=1882752 RepID=UPI000928AE44|nr:APC family permease [Singulisphaera sp. GP187]SIO61572.1 Amino acid permease [Singulisphaera sp. GP187]
MDDSVGPRPRREHRSAGPFLRWLLEGHLKKLEGPWLKKPNEHEHPWWQVMCLTGVDYFSTLGYQPGIAALAAGALSPIATLILVLLTLFGALPIYARVSRESPHGEGSIAMLEHLLSWWQGKLFILALLGFVATDFIITITLSAADATAHLVENPFLHDFLHGHEVAVALGLIAALGIVFLKGFKEAIGIAVALVAVYLVLNAVVIGYGLYRVVLHPKVIGDWNRRLFEAHGNPMVMLAISLMVFPKLALGLSGFETGVALMPLVKGGPKDTPESPEGRIRNTRKLLVVAALIMSAYLISSSLVTTLLIPAEEFRPASNGYPAGKANGRALSYLAHGFLGEMFGSIYDLSTILILWFAGASAMAGLLNIVPRYLPRFGMAPEWTRAARPLVLIYTAIAFAVTIIFRASVDAQGGAYATGVLVLMTSASVAVTLSAKRRGSRRVAAGFGAIALVFAYTTVVNVLERPDGVKIASFFITAIVAVSFVSRIWRTLELRVEATELDETAQAFIDDLGSGGIHIIANQPDERDVREYQEKEREAREDFQIPPDHPLLFFEVYVRDPSDFSEVLHVSGSDVGGYRVLRAEATAVPNAIAAFLLHLRDITGRRPNAYFNWGEGDPLLYLLKYLLSGQGDIAPVTHEVLRRAEPDPARRPKIHVGV